VAEVDHQIAAIRGQMLARQVDVIRYIKVEVKDLQRFASWDRC
jgi:hypothetical protein